MNLDRTVQPAVEPVSLAEAKLHCRVDADITADDTLLTSLISAAREAAEEYLWRSLITQTWLFTLDGFPSGFIELPMGVVQSIAIQYVDADGDLQTLDSAEYVTAFSRSGSRVAPASGRTWPVTEPRIGAVRLTAVCGYGDAASDVPHAIKAAILLTVGHLYMNREDVLVGVAGVQLPSGCQRLLDPYRLYRH